MARSAAAILLMVLAMVYPGLTAPSGPKDEPDCNSQDVGKLRVSDDDGGILNFEIGSSSLEDIQEKLGAGAQSSALRG